MSDILEYWRNFRSFRTEKGGWICQAIKIFMLNAEVKKIQVGTSSICTNQALFIDKKKQVLDFSSEIIILCWTNHIKF